MKARLRPHGGVANPRDSYGYRCGLRLALGANPSLSSCSDTSVSLYWADGVCKPMLCGSSARAIQAIFESRIIIILSDGMWPAGNHQARWVPGRKTID